MSLHAFFLEYQVNYKYKCIMHCRQLKNLMLFADYVLTAYRVMPAVQYACVNLLKFMIP